MPKAKRNIEYRTRNIEGRRTEAGPVWTSAFDIPCSIFDISFILQPFPFSAPRLDPGRNEISEGPADA
jgi:hypothetical protein